ncbi:MAG: hypothetical protein Q9M50_14665 [Methylococcales bacterium]|nr:hypothetical protein [Methylococcales bacterium]
MTNKITPTDKIENIPAEIDIDGAQNINKIRDILFGAEMRKNNSRFSSLEVNLSKESAHLRDDMEQRMSSLENLIQREFETLSDKLDLEKKERQKSLSSMESSLKKADDLLNQRLDELENKSLDEIRKLRNQEHENVKGLRQNLHQLREETNALIEKELDILRKTKIDKASIASLFASDNL